MPEAYVHGRGGREAIRLRDQAGATAQIIHGDTRYAPGETVLEAGCGVGAQTVALARNSPHARFTAVDTSATSLTTAEQAVREARLTNVAFAQADLYALPYAPASFDHVFVCFVLEHLPRPVEALVALRRVLKPGGTITVVEGDHGSTYFHPDSAAAHAAIACQVRLQAAAGGNALIGRELYPLLRNAGYDDVRAAPHTVYVDGSRPDLIDGFTRRTFTAMIEGVRDAALAAGITDAEEFDRGIADLYRTASEDGVFCYTFFKAVANRRGGRA